MLAYVEVVLGNLVTRIYALFIICYHGAGFQPWTIFCRASKQTNIPKIVSDQ